MLVKVENEVGSAPVATSGDNVYVSWPKNITDRFDIMFRASLDKGRTFGPEINLSNSNESHSIDQHMVARETNVYVSWWEIHEDGTSTSIQIES